MRFIVVWPKLAWSVHYVVELGIKRSGCVQTLMLCPLWNKAGNRGAVRNTGLSMDADMTVIRPCYFVPQNI